jgi:tetratricopeptide (TPR) repeat protein
MKPLFLFNRFQNVFPCLGFLVTSFFIWGIAGCAGTWDELSLKKEQSEALKLYHKASADKLVVFVHGINGHYRNTWTSKKNKFFWPEHLAINDPAFRNSDILLFEYKSECGPDLNIPEIAKNLEIQISKWTSKYQYKSLSFVAYSMGGLVAREFILSRHKRLEPKLQMESLVLLSTPNHGSGLANFVKFFCHSDQLGDLETGRNGYIDILNDRWRENFEQINNSKNFHFSAGYEIVPTLGIGIIVDKNSATTFAQQVQGFTKDHVNIAKPKNPNDDLYIWVKQSLLREVSPLLTRGFLEPKEERANNILFRLHKEMKGTVLEKTYSLIGTGDLELALNQLAENEVTRGPQDLTYIKTIFAKAQILELKSDFSEALKYYEKASHLAPKKSLFLNEIGLMYSSLEDFDKAIEYYRKALNVDIETYGPDHPKLAIRWNNIGSAWHSKRKFDTAIEFYKKALAINIDSFGPNHPNVGISLNNLGEAWRAKGKFDKGIEFLEKARSIFIKARQMDRVKIVENHLKDARIGKSSE